MSMETSGKKTVENQAAQGKKKQSKRLQHWMIIAGFLIVYDMFTAAVSYFATLWLRFDCQIGELLDATGSGNNYFVQYLRYIWIYLIVLVLVFMALRLYKSIWRFASFSELIRILVATLVTGGIHPLIVLCLSKLFPDTFSKMPNSYYIIGPIIQLAFTLTIRFSYRLLLLVKNKFASETAMDGRAIIIGAGEAGKATLRDISGDKNNHMSVVCFIDDNPNKWKRTVDGVHVYGGRDDILSAVEKFKADKIFVAIPSAPLCEQREIMNICNETGCEVKILPHTMQVVRGEVTLNSFKEVAVEDLLGRDVIKVNNEDIFNHLVGKRILVTGGGGSIGSELCRQIASHNPRELVIFDIYENNAYGIQQELRHDFPNLRLTVLIGSVRDSRRLDDVFRTHKPDIVFHAAAHKHVPLMEDSPQEAVKNNCFGTWKTAMAAIRYGAQRFVLISTDKAVRPANVMGASKRVCEKVIQTMDEYIKTGKAQELPNLFTHYSEEFEEERKHSIPADAHTEFVAVRFGNVLGSNGSVIPLFRKQIAQGGPVTVTHPDIIRYFMTIPEAVSLVLQASVYAHGGEIFVFDMGEPVKIDTLARNMIKLAGLQPDVDIKIVYTGLRPGEKLYEEKLMAEEGLEKTENDLIFIGKPIAFDKQEFIGEMKQLFEYAYKDEELCRKTVLRMGGALK